MHAERARYLAVLITTVFLVSGCPGRDQQTPRNTLATAEETVRAYCDLDAAGARLTSQTWQKVLPFISWSEEAGGDRAIVIAGHRIASVKKNDEKTASVTVEYQVLGTLSGEYVASRRTETVRFLVVKTGRGWKITEPDTLPPHVLQQAMVRHLERTKDLEAAEKVRNGEAQ